MTPDEIFRLAHEGLPRQAPGSAETLATLLRLVGPLPGRPRVVDIGCGNGAASVPLTVATGGTVVAVDTHLPFLELLRADADTAGVGERVRAVQATMQDLPLPDAAADLVWAEGSACLMGFDAALAAWRRLLAPGGTMLLTEAGWTTPAPAPGARAFWDGACPAMRSTDANVRAAMGAGWTVVATYLLPDADWAQYYDPLGARIAQLRRGHPGTGSVLDAVAREIEVRREHGADYGYTAYVLRAR